MKKFRIISLLLATVLFFTACGFELDLPVGLDFKVTTYKDYSGLLIKYIDVKQGDSELIMLPDKKTLLIDGGDVGTSDELVEFIKDEGFEKIDYTRLHHCGSVKYNLAWLITTKLADYTGGKTVPRQCGGVKSAR